MTVTSAGLPGPDYFVLASSSPRRRQFLAALDIPFAVIAPGKTDGIPEVDETPLPNEAAAQMVERLSQAKAQAVASRLVEVFPAAKDYPRLVIIAADTSVVLDNAILGKPASPAEAVAMLSRLRQRPHFVLSGLTVVRASSQASVTHVHTSKVWMRAYTRADIEAYVAGGSPLDKAGAYGIQDEPFAPVARLKGCFASVMGFPLGEMADMLPQLGLALPNIAPQCGLLIKTTCCQETQNASA
jgi:MAF protein